jgi:AraC family transcriptional regulator
MSADGRAELRPGRYFGAIGGRSETPLAVLSEVIHRDARELPLHDHALAYFCMLVQGGYAETIAGRALEYAPFRVGFHPARVPHRDRVGFRGARFLCLEIRPRSLDAFAVKLSTAPALLPGDVTLQMLRLCDAMASGTLSPVVLDSVAWELCGDAGNAPPAAERQRPRWLERCLELVEDAHGEALTVAGMAHAVGVHPVHLSREFRRRYRQTLGEYVHKVRIRSACARMTQSDEPLAAIAARCGFADQSHFCRVFRALVGRSPSGFRAALAHHGAAARYSM